MRPTWAAGLVALIVGSAAPPVQAQQVTLGWPDTAGEAGAVTPEGGPAATPGTEADETARIAELEAQVQRLSKGLDAAVEASRRLEERLNGAETPAEGEEEAAAPERVAYEPGKGLRIMPAPGRFELTMGGFVWVHYSGRGFFYDDDGELADGTEYEDGDRQSWTNEFSVNEMRLWFVADMGANAIVRAVFQPSMSWSATGLNFGLQDGYLELRLNPAAIFRVGQSLVCYDWETNTAPPVMPIVGLSPMTRYFTHGRDLGLMFYGQIPNNRFYYAVGAWNGGGRNKPNDNHELLVTGVFRVQVLGTLAPGWGWTDLEQSHDVNLTLGGGFAYDSVNRVDANGRSVLEGDIWQTNINAHLRLYGLSIATVMQIQGIDGTNPADPENPVAIERLSLGGLVHVGYVPWRNRLELIARFSFVDPDLDNDDDLGYEVLGGLTFFVVGQSAELTAQYAYQSHLYSFTTPDTIAHVVTIQAQGWF
jgi:hypothetical protein